MELIMKYIKTAIATNTDIDNSTSFVQGNTITDVFDIVEKNGMQTLLFL